MKLFRFGPAGAEKMGVVGSDGVAREVLGIDADYGELFFGGWGLKHLSEALSSEGDKWPTVDLAQVRLGSPVARPSKIIGIGLNYKDHATETGSRLPVEPKIFMKATTALCGVNDELILPRGSEHTDYEVELAVVIGKRASYVEKSDALSYVAGYTICNDYSERDYQKNRAGQFVKGKSADTFAPLGPFLVTPEHHDFASTRLWCSVNGEMRQDSTTSEMVFDVPSLISSLSQYMTLLPGDVISTGTPSGVGLGHSPPVYLKPGDVVRYGIDGIGEAEQRVCSFESRG